ncbi:MAG: hypothetical protein O2822_04275 [Chloroflexi bacterium]|nr:hypothetical protein [Chloroflexota bacterium]
MTASNRWLGLVAAGIAIAVIAGILVTTFAGGEREYAPGTPERAVQDYLRAVSDRDATAAFAFFSPELLERCEPKPRESISSRGDSTIRATLDRSEVRDSTAEVRVRLTESYNTDSPFGSGESTFSQIYVLTRADGEWRFSEAPWPTYCPQPIPVR